MRSWNRYYKIAFWGAIITFVLQLIVSIAVDPFLASAFSPFYAIWGIVLVVGWRKQHPRQ